MFLFLTFHFISEYSQLTGEGNSNLFQYTCLEKSHEQRSPAGYTLWDCKESDTTEHLCV